MSIANKLIYLNGTKDKLKDSINNIGGSITNETTFRAYATELDNIYSNIPKTTGEGSNLSLTTIKGRINVDDIKGDTTQDGTPTPSTPIDIEVVTGQQDVVVQNKNLFDKTKDILLDRNFSNVGNIEALTGAFVQETYLSVLNSTAYIISTTNNYSSTTNYRLVICEYDSNKTFIKRNIGISGTSYSVTTTANTKYVRLGASMVTIDELQFEKRKHCYFLCRTPRTN